MKFSCGFRDCNEPAKYQYAKEKLVSGGVEVTLDFRCDKHRRKKRPKKDEVKK
jgi:hypothetical protein